MSGVTIQIGGGAALVDWLQALGSIAAVVVALGIAIFSWRSQSRERRASERRFKETAAQLLDSAAKRIALAERVGFRDAPLEKRFQTNVLRRIKIVERRLSRFPVHETAEPRLIHIFVITEDRLRMIRKKCRAWNAQLAAGRADEAKRQRLLAALKKNKADARRYADEATTLARG